MRALTILIGLLAGLAAGIALLMLSPVVFSLTRDYFSEQNAA